MDQKKKISNIFAIVSVVLILLGVTGVILGAMLAVSFNTILFWISLGGILPLSIIFGVIALVFDINYRKQKKAV